MSSVFTNILILLSFAELGIGNAFTYSLYKPLNEKNEEKITSLIHYFSSIYKWILIIITIIGLCVIPFLDKIINGLDSYKISEITIIYILFLVNSVCSYTYVYKKTLLIADQKQYIVSIYTQLLFIIQSVIQICILILLENFIFYLITQIMFTLLTNYIISKKTDQIYPYLNIKFKKTIEEIEKKSILNNVKGLFLYKIGSIFLNGTDNILISIFIGVKTVGLTTNYILIISSLSTLFGQVLNSLTGTIGKLNTSSNNKMKYKGFKLVFFSTIWIFGYLSGGLYIFLDKFIYIWIGESYLLDSSLVIILIINFYLASTHFASYTARITMGLFDKGKYSPLIAAVLNILISYILVINYGVIGIFIGTLISKGVTMFSIDPYLVYKHVFKIPVRRYWYKYFLYSILVIFNIYICSNIITQEVKGSLINLFVNILIYSIIFNLIFILMFYKNSEFKMIISKLNFLKGAESHERTKKIRRKI